MYDYDECTSCGEEMDNCECNVCSDCNSEPCECCDSFESCPDGCGYDVADCNCN